MVLNFDHVRGPHTHSSVDFVFAHSLPLKRGIFTRMNTLLTFTVGFITLIKYDYYTRECCLVVFVMWSCECELHSGSFVL